MVGKQKVSFDIKENVVREECPWKRRKKGKDMEMEMEEREAYEDIQCVECGSMYHNIDHTSFDRICCNCGFVSSPYIEIGEGPYIPPKRNARKNHFEMKIFQIDPECTYINTVVVEKLRVRFTECIRCFFATQHMHKRKNMLNYHFVFTQLLREMRIPTDFMRIKMPKERTCVGLQRVWCLMEEERKNNIFHYRLEDENEECVESEEEINFL